MLFRSYAGIASFGGASLSFAGQPFFDQAKAIAWLDRLADADTQTLDRETPTILRLASFSLMQQRFAIEG